MGYPPPGRTPRRGYLPVVQLLYQDTKDLVSYQGGTPSIPLQKLQELIRVHVLTKVLTKGLTNRLTKVPVLTNVYSNVYSNEHSSPQSVFFLPRRSNRTYPLYVSTNHHALFSNHVRDRRTDERCFGV